MPHNVTQCHTVPHDIHALNDALHDLYRFFMSCLYIVFTLFLHDSSSLFPSNFFEVFLQSFTVQTPRFLQFSVWLR